MIDFLLILFFPEAIYHADAAPSVTTNELDVSNNYTIDFLLLFSRAVIRGTVELFNIIIYAVVTLEIVRKHRSFDEIS